MSMFRRRKNTENAPGPTAQEREHARASTSALEEDLDALRHALDVGEGMLPGDAVDHARTVLERAEERRSFTTGRTVVAVLGATGSGKSSLTNALVGRPIAEVAARRPTTREPLAAVWGSDDAGPVLDWLGIPDRVQVNRPRELPVGPRGEDLSGLVLVDMPDVDSTEARHRATAARLAKSVDVLLWVLDPQKYADAAIHHDFLAPMAEHAQVTMVVLNQVDTLSEEERTRILEDLGRILADDGLRDVQVRGVSARTEEGLPELLTELARVAGTTRATHERLRADVRTAGRALAEGAGIDVEGEAGNGAATAATSGRAGRGRSGDEVAVRVPEDAVDRLVAASAHAAGEKAVTGAVARSYRRQAYSHVGWVPIRWLAGLRSDPMKNLHLDGKELDPALVRSSLPAATPVQEAGVRSAAQALATRAGEGLPDRWRARLLEQTQDRVPGAVADLDGAIVGTDTENGVKPAWWSILGFLQWVAFAALVVGLGWLLLIALGSYLQFEIATPLLGPIPWPVVLLGGGIVLGLVLWGLGTLAARSGAARRAERVRGRIRAQVGEAVRAELVAPIEHDLASYAEVRAVLRRLVRR